MTNIKNLIQKCEQHNELIKANLEAWTPSQEFVDQVLASIRAGKTVDSELGQTVFKIAFTDKAFLQAQELDALAAELSVEEYKEWMFKRIDETSKTSGLIAATMQAKLQEAIIGSLIS